MYVEEEVTEDSSVYDTLFAQYYDGWTEAFGKYKPNMKNISDIVASKEQEFGKSRPDRCAMFDAFNTGLSDVKVVIWNKNPCISKNFYTNIFKELSQEKQVPIDFGGTFGAKNVQGWAKQGVLFMNVAMCYSNHHPDPFSDLWLRFANIVIQILNTNVPNCIHLLWGKECEKISDSISSREVYTTSHPCSPRMGFFGCNHFIKVNITLERQKKTPIKWFHSD